MINRELIDSLILPPVSYADGKRHIASLNDKYKAIIQNNGMDAPETMKEYLDAVMEKIEALRVDAGRIIYNTYQTRKDSRTGRVTSVLNALSSWIAFGRYFEYLYSDTVMPTNCEPIEDLGPKICHVLENLCAIPGCKLLFDIGHEKLNATVLCGDPFAILTKYAALIISYICIKKKQPVLPSTVREAMNDIVYKSTLLAESGEEHLFYEVGYLDPEEEIGNYVKQHYPEFDVNKYKLAYMNAARWNSQFQFIQSQLMELAGQHIDSLMLRSQCPATTPIMLGCSIREDINVLMGGGDNLLSFRLGKIAMILRDGIVYNSKKQKITNEDMEFYIKAQAESYMKDGMFTELPPQYQ